MKTYSIQGIFSPISLITGQAPQVQKRGHVYSVNRQEAAKILRIGKREKMAAKIA